MFRKARLGLHFTYNKAFGSVKNWKKIQPRGSFSTAKSRHFNHLQITGIFRYLKVIYKFIISVKIDNTLRQLLHHLNFCRTRPYNATHGRQRGKRVLTLLILSTSFTDGTLERDVQFYIILEIQSILHTYRMLWHHWLLNGFLKWCKLGKFENENL